jgi:hypothetical protein
MLFKKIIFCLLFFSLMGNKIFSQNTVGMILHEEETFEGFTLFSPSANSTVYLIDNCGKLINTWECSNKPGNAVYLQPDGSLYRAGQLINQQIHEGGAGGLIEKYNWENDLLWSFNYNSPTYRAHHDFQVLPNGNILILAWEVIEKEEVIANGRDTTLLSDQKLWPEHIVEIEPIGVDSGKIVWAWHAWDHLIQDFDTTKLNYGNVGEHPEKIDLNYIRPGKDGRDWQHANSIHYNPSLDQILISVLYFDEVWMIDHHTTTQEAQTAKGDLLFRWGNPQTYQQGDESDKKLFGQHHAHWIEEGLPDEGKIMVFNNGVGRSDSLFSNVVIIDPTIENGSYSKNNGGKYLPEDYDWVLNNNTPTDFYSRFISGAQQLPNGNILINDGAHGTFFEINAAEEKVWEYVNPVTIFGIATQGNMVVNPSGEGTNTVFRATKFPKYYPAFIGKDVLPQEPIELNPDLSLCELPDTTINLPTLFLIYPNPVTTSLHIVGYSGVFNFYNLLGQVILNGKMEASAKIDVQGYPPGVYFLALENMPLQKIIIH